MQIKRVKIRCAVDVGARTVSDVSTGSYPQFPAGSDVQFEFAFFYRGALLDITPWDALTVSVIDASDILGPRLMDKPISKSPGVVPEEKLDTSLDKTSWADGSKQHALITFDATQTMYCNPGVGLYALPLWLLLRVTTSGSEQFTVVGAKAVATKDGHSGGGAPEPGDPQYYTKAEIDALFLKKSGLELSFQAVKIWNPDQGKYQFLTLRGLAGHEEVSVANEV